MSPSLDSRVPLMHITATFLAKGSSRPVNTPEYSARLYDKDVFEDDFIEVTSLTPEGEARFTLHPENMSDWDSFLEIKPDLYIVLERYGEKVFSTPVALNLDVQDATQFDPDKGLFFDLGTYLVEVPESE